MKNKIIVTLIISIILIAIMISTVFAVKYEGIYTNISIGGTDEASSSAAITERILGTLQVLGTIISVVALIIIGIRYMISSVEEKAQVKGVIGYYIIGCVLVFTTTNLIKFIYDIINSL